MTLMKKVLDFGPELGPQAVTKIPELGEINTKIRAF